MKHLGAMMFEEAIIGTFVMIAKKVYLIKSKYRDRKISFKASKLPAWYFYFTS